MSLKDMISDHITRVFMNFEHFAEWHTWNGKKILCVVDEDSALKRKNNNVVDLSWDNNISETLIYVPVKDFPGRVEPNEHIFFDNIPMKITQRQEDMGMYTILLTGNEAKAVNL